MKMKFLSVPELSVLYKYLRCLLRQSGMGLLLVASLMPPVYAGPDRSTTDGPKTIVLEAEADPHRTAGDPAVAEYPSLDSLLVRHQPYLEKISAYKPMYFLVGTHPEDSKFQISFKYRLFDTESLLAEKVPLSKGIHFGYTQTSFWDLASDSKPFEETSYKPEFFYISPNIRTGFSSIKGFFVQTGLEHESNGMAQMDSRSTNYLYVHPMLIFYSEKNKAGMAIGPKMWLYVDNDDETNPDLEDYRGHVDLGLKLGLEDGLVLASSLRWAAKGGSIQMDVTYPLSRLLPNALGIYLNVQYVDSLAESLLRYDERIQALRIGVAIVR